MRRRWIATAAVLGAAALVGSMSGMANAATEVKAQRVDVSFIAPTSGQSLYVQLKTQTQPWGQDVCYRWRGGNVGSAASIQNGLEFWNSYRATWEAGGTRPYQGWGVKAALHASGDCSGAAITTKTVFIPIEANPKTPVIDLR